MKNLIFLLCVFLLVQNCESYKAVTVPEIKRGKTYAITLKNGQEIETQCENVEDENISFMINENIVKLPKSEIQEAKRKKVNTYKLLGGLAIATVGVILIVKSADDDNKLKPAGDN